jgi:hypothetical protein
MPIDRRWLILPNARVVRPSPESLVEEALTGSTATFQLDGRAVTAEIHEGCLLWASLPQDLRRISGLFIQK